MTRWTMTLMGLLTAAPAWGWQVTDERILTPAELKSTFLTVDPVGHTTPLEVAQFVGRARRMRLLTVTQSGTIQEWDAETGERLRLLRLPTDSDTPLARGRPWDAMVSDDGRTLVYRTLYRGGKDGESIWYFIAVNLENESLRVLFTAPAVPYTAARQFAQALSPDGRWLAVREGVRAGADPKVVRIHNVADGKEAARFSVEGRSPDHLCFSPDSQSLLTSPHNGTFSRVVSLVLKNDKLTIGKTVMLGERPNHGGGPAAWLNDNYAVTCHEPDITKEGGGDLRVFDVTTGKLAAGPLALKLLDERVGKAPSTARLQRLSALRGVARTAPQILSTVTFTDGPQSRMMATLVDWKNNKGAPIRPWSGINGRWIGHAAASPNGKLVMTAFGGPDGLTIYNAEDLWKDEKRATPLRVVAQLAGVPRNMVHIAEDGSAVGWRMRVREGHRGLDLKEMKVLSFDKGSGTRKEWGNLFTRNGAVHKLDGWTLTRPTATTLHVTSPEGKLVKLEAREGTEGYSLVKGGYVYKPDGYDLWDGRTGGLHQNVPPGMGARHQAVSGDGTLMAILRHDLTISLFSTTNKVTDANLLRLFAYGNDWVAWTPEQGYYACSPGAERYILWHSNPDKLDRLATLLPAETYADELYHPDLIRKVLQERSVEKALAAINQSSQVVKPFVPEKDVDLDSLPRVKLVEPDRLEKTVRQSEPKYEVKVQAVMGGKPVADVRLFHNGRPVQVAPTVEQGQHVWKVELLEGANKFQVLARSNNHVGFSPEAEVTYERPGMAGRFAPILRVLTIGSKYERPEHVRNKRTLKCAENDATAIYQALRTHHAGLFRDVKLYGMDRTTPLLGKNATLANIRARLTLLEKEAEAGDVVVILFSGHGLVEKDVFYLLPDDGDEGNLSKSALSGPELKESLVRIKAQRVLLLLDACHSGAIGSEGLSRQLYSENSGVAVMCAASGEETAQEGKDNGLFCARILQALEGKGHLNLNNGLVSLYHLEQYVMDNVPLDSNDQQHPVSARSPRVSASTFFLSKPITVTKP